MTGTRESDNHDDGRQAKRPRLQGRGRRARVPTDPLPAENQQGEHTSPMQTQSNDTNATPAPAVTDSTSVDLTRYKTWRGKQSSSARVYRVLTSAIQEREVHTTTFALNAISHLIWYLVARVKGRTMILANQRTVSCAKMMRIYGIALFV